MKIAIVVLNFNGLENTLECLESLKNLNQDQFHMTIFVVDNCSNDGSKKTLSGRRDIIFIENDENLGYSGGNNVGIKEAIATKADFILVLNNDTIVDSALIINMLSAASRADIICPKIYFAKGFEFHKHRYTKKELGKVVWYAGGKIDWNNVLGIHLGVDEVDKGQFSKRKEVELATGACFLAKKRVFEKIGFFDERYFLYLEDMDFSVRAKKAGFKIIFEPEAFLWHKNAGSAGGSGSTLQDYFITRNRLLFAFKYSSSKTKLAILREAFRNLKNATKRKALLDFLSGNFGKGSYLK